MPPSCTTCGFCGEIEPAEDLSVRLDIENAFDEVICASAFADVWVKAGPPRRLQLTIGDALRVAAWC